MSKILKKLDAPGRCATYIIQFLVLGSLIYLIYYMLTNSNNTK